MLSEGSSVVRTCEHHFVTIDGVASVGYIPVGEIIGLSKCGGSVMGFAQ